MTHSDSRPNQDLSDELAALRAIVEGTAGHTGDEFFRSLVRHLAAAVGTRYAFVAVFAGGTKARTLAFWFRDRIGENIEWDVMGTPCEDVPITSHSMLSVIRSRNQNARVRALVPPANSATKALRVPTAAARWRTRD